MSGALLFILVYTRAMSNAISDHLVTQPMLVADLTALGVQPGMVLVVHSSLSSLGWVNGGAAAVILALEEVLTPAGTLVMPTHSSDQSDPANWQNPPAPEAWWEQIRATMPAYDPSLTPTYNMGAIPETFRKQTGVIRSNHPIASFAAWGKQAARVAADHPLTPLFGTDSPLGRVYDLGGWVLLLGVGHNRNTSLHVAEDRTNLVPPVTRDGTAMLVNGVRQWVAFDDLGWDEFDFDAVGAAFARETGLQREGRVGQAAALLMPQRALIDYAVTWFETHR
jgi:aminoglycoside 3-N-acetyltransferase